MSSVTKRMKTFKILDASKFAEAGFYEIGEELKCWKCGKVFEGITNADDPYQLHSDCSSAKNTRCLLNIFTAAAEMGEL